MSPKSAPAEVREAVAHVLSELDSGALRRVFERVIDESRRLERLAGEAEAGKKG